MGLKQRMDKASLWMMIVEVDARQVVEQVREVGSTHHFVAGF